LVFTLGKINLTAYFDSNEVANDETIQFLSPGFVNSAAIEFPDDNGPGFRATLAPLELVNISVGWGEGDADWNELGERSFFISEVGFHPQFGELQGNYRFYGWYRRHHRDEDFVSWDDRVRGISDCKKGWGLGLSLDQAISPYISLFARVGYQDKEVYDFAWAWSVGAEIRGVYWGREHDAIGVAFGMAMISENYKDFMKCSGEPWQKEDESHLELYYRFQITEHTAISPDFQILWNAQGDNRFNPVIVLRIRCTLEFLN
jgi:high affinity Mn2+ porin